MQIKIYHKFRNVNFAFMLEHNYFVLFALFFCDYFASKLLWKRNSEKNKKKGKQNPSRSPVPACLPRTRPSSPPPSTQADRARASPFPPLSDRWAPPPSLSATRDPQVRAPFSFLQSVPNRTRVEVIQSRDTRNLLAFSCNRPLFNPP